VPSSALVLFSFGAFISSTWLTSRFCRPNSRLYILDHPNERSLHTQPTPRTGGIAIVAACMVAGALAAVWFAQDMQRLAWLTGAMLLVGTTSFLDDRLRLASGYRMLVHLVAAGMLVFGGFRLPAFALPGFEFALSSTAGFMLSLFFIAWMINLYNFMDGMDGFAGGMAVFGFGALAVFGLWEGQWLFAALNLIVVAGAAGFLVFNFPPARIFMGDVGSSSLGLLAAAFSLWGARDGIFPFWIALLVFSPFIVDATVTLLRRAARGERVWEAHRTHYYQRLVQLGWGHRRTVLWEYGVMVGCAISALVAKGAIPAVQWSIILFWIGVYMAFVAGVRQLEGKSKRDNI